MFVFLLLILGLLCTFQKLSLCQLYKIEIIFFQVVAYFFMLISVHFDEQKLFLM